jgi:hypothetical protein
MKRYQEGGESKGMRKLPYKPEEDRYGVKKLPYKPEEDRYGMRKLPYTPPSEGGKPSYTPKPDMRSYEEQQKDIDAKREKREAEKAAAKEREARDAEMDRQMREGREKAKKKPLYKKGGAVKSSASKRADGCAKKGKTRGKMV